jgi:hypothetical protein
MEISALNKFFVAEVFNKSRKLIIEVIKGQDITTNSIERTK